MFEKYSKFLNNDLKGYGVLNYLSSHDDGEPFDANREEPYESATMLMLTPGTAQMYYGDESARSLVIPDTEGDATLRSFMNWDFIANQSRTKDVLSHWQKLGQFRAKHPAVGAGVHQMIKASPYYFYRNYKKGDFKDIVVIGLELQKGTKLIDVTKIFEEGDTLRDAYSDTTAKVENGKIKIDSDFDIVLIEKI